MLDDVAAVSFYRPREPSECGLDSLVRYLLILVHETCRANNIGVQNDGKLGARWHGWDRRSGMVASLPV